MTTAELIERLRNWPADFMSDRVILLEAAARLREQEAEASRLRVLATKATDEWQSWVDDQLQGTSHYDGAIAEVHTHRAALATDQKGGEDV